MPEPLTLRDLLDSPEGRAFLAERSIFVDPDEFATHLRPPDDGRLASFLGLHPGYPVYAGQQILCDYQRSAAAKFEMARDLVATNGARPFLVWTDTDRCGASPLSTTIRWRDARGPFSARLVSQRYRSVETRFVPVTAVRLHELINKLHQSIWSGPRMKALEDLLLDGGSLLEDSQVSLAEVNQAIASFLLEQQLECRLPAVFVSAIGKADLFTDVLTEAVDRIEDIIVVFNEAIANLQARNVDPQVHPLAENYLPLHYSCPADGHRLNLTRITDGTDHFAVARCGCGADYRFWLGSHTTTLAGLMKTDRWSTDVTIPIYLNDLVSGCVAGRSSALYGIVLGDVLKRVLGRRPIPTLVPPRLATVLSATTETDHGEVDSLVYEYLTA